jgi:hypothetical protein
MSLNNIVTVPAGSSPPPPDYQPTTPPDTDQAITPAKPARASCAQRSQIWIISFLSGTAPTSTQNGGSARIILTFLGYSG